MSQELTEQTSKELSEEAKKEGLIRPKDRVEITYNGKDSYHDEGAKELVHPVLAQKFVNKGIASITSVKGDSSGVAKVQDAKTPEEGENKKKK